MRMIKVIYLLAFLLLISLCDASRSNRKRVPIKSIKRPNGDIIDCIDIYQQPAFDHPLLKNHTIQEKPSYYPKGFDIGDIHQISPFMTERCPEGSIPIIRSNKEDLLTEESIRNKKRFRNKSATEPQLPGGGVHEHALASVRQGNYYGTKVTINVWQPQVQNSNEFSLAQTWILGGTSQPIPANSIEAGWQVFPDIYGSDTPRLFVYWTNDGYRSTGCYNLRCSGFVQTNSQITLGGSISPVSTYNGPQYEITIMIWKDNTRKVWWLQYMGMVVGYWPASLFTYLAGTADVIEWGGEVFSYGNGGSHTTTQMGSGHFAEEGSFRAAYFQNLQTIDASLNLNPVGDQAATLAETPGCYDITPRVSGSSFYYGGPGRNPKCP